IIGTEAGARAAPDGYTLVMLSSGPVTVNPYVYKNVPYDPVKDFTPIANLAATAHVLVVRPDFTAKTIAELVALVKAKPGHYTFASPGAGTSQHLTTEMFRYRAGLDMVHVPYRGSAAAQVDLMGGQVNMLFDTITSVGGAVKDGKLRIIAVSTSDRSPFVPDVPTISESGLAGFKSGGWIGIAGPPGMPAPIVEKLNAEIIKALALPEMQERLKAMAFISIGDAPQHFAAYIKSETTKYAELIKAIGLKLD
ncbi:MAG: tripartite tricarboxylate transporter substrate binding protein, partial [Alphaproteobacteria bacterium]|nr:tripartite tricarboxylate transporter substrate binding protein [Alphaproteobacteria bacterium]